MTVHDLHDALTLLPADLITAADRVRTSPKTNVVPWKRFLPMAACLVLLIGLGMMVRGELLSHVVMQKNAVAESPAAAAPMAPLPEEQEVAANEAGPGEPAADRPAAGSVTGGESDMKEELQIDHSHRFAEEEQTVEDPVKGYCGNMTVTIDVAGERFEISGSDAVAITKLLINLDYDLDQVCRCMTDITVDTETLTDIRINLGEAFARCEKGQAALTEEQVKTLQKIIETLQ